MQSYSNPESRNTMRAAGNPMKTGAAIGGGGNQTQGRWHTAQQSVRAHAWYRYNPNAIQGQRRRIQSAYGL